jgi:MtaA/CmuA family methyltransferase
LGHKSEMTGKERFMACLLRKEADRVAVGNPVSIATVELMDITGASFPEAHLNPEVMAALAAGGYDELGFDTVSPYFSVQQEAAAAGCAMDWGAVDRMPDAVSHPVVKPEDFKFTPDILDRPPIRTVLSAIKILKQKYGDRAAIVGKVMGPWTLAYHLHGVQDFLLQTILDPPEVRGFLEAFMPLTIAFANAQFEAGADVVTLADHATGDLVGPDAYRDFLFNVHKELAQKIAGPIILHICGKTLDRMPDIASTGFTAFHFDSKNKAGEAKAAVGNKIVLIGNINNPATLLNGKEDDIETEVCEALRAGVEIIAPECAVPLTTPNRNLKAIVESVKKYCQ